MHRHYFPSYKNFLEFFSGAAVFEIPIGNYASPVDRLNKCHEILKACTNSVAPLLSDLYANTFGYHIGNLGYKLGKNRIISTGTPNY